MKIGYASCRRTQQKFHKILLLIILTSAFTDNLATSQPKCTPYTDCIENHYVIYKSSLTIQSESRSNVEFYHLYNNSFSLKDQISYRLKWKIFQLNDYFPECDKDYVVVFTGCGSNPKQVATFCGRTIPHDIYSLDGCFTLQLKNGRTYRSKFEVEVQSIPYSKLDTSLCTQNLSSYNSNNSVILSPGWPATSPKNISSCTWKIRATKDKVTVLNFFDLDLHVETVQFSAINLWFVTKNACIKLNNERTYDNIPSFTQCQERCEKESWCQSLDYNTLKNKCHLSKLNSSSSVYYNPCYVTPNDFIYAEIGRGPIQSGLVSRKFNFTISKKNTRKNVTMYMTFNEEVQVKYLQDINARQDRKTNRFALGWMFIDTSLQSTSNSKESSSTDGASVGGIIFFCIVACFFLQGCYRRNGEGGGCTVPTCPQRATRSQPRSQLCSRNIAIATRRSSVGNQDQTNTRTHRSSIGDQEQADTPRLRSRTLSNSSRRHSFALEIPTPGTMATGGGMGIDNIGLEMPTRNDPFDPPPAYNDVTLGPSPPSEAPPPSYDEALNMTR